MSSPLKVNGYGLKGRGIRKDHLIYKFFPTRREAVAYAKYQFSNHPEHNWKDSYTVVKVEMIEVKK